MLKNACLVRFMIFLLGNRPMPSFQSLLHVQIFTLLAKASAFHNNLSIDNLQVIIDDFVYMHPRRSN